MALTKLWQSPSPSSSFLEGVALKTLPKRSCALSFRYEGEDGGWVTCELRFREVAAFKCTYLPALTTEMIQSAYDKLIDVGKTAWLGEVNASRGHAKEGVLFRHLRICFDDGPCYEFLCTDFEVGSEIASD